ncbi:MAG TPA: pantoate--beta-alanine ligase [Dehalococcoidia bacterium]|nr:pantoate--beta-alanine ligase [Dehalococcoidia bacterium]
MEVIRTVAEMEHCREAAGGSVGLVPTMGYLHEGHLSLVRRARDDNDLVVVSIFVNPSQFGPGEDLARYPRDEERDLALLREDGVDIVFAPSVEAMYPPGFDDWVEVSGPVSQRLEGEHRPGHFRGVTTVVARLFRIIRPGRAYFGQKDAQQLRVIRRMVAGLGLPIDIIGLPIVREPDGLAMSSRNVYLSPAERAHALVISHALHGARRAFGEGERDASSLRDQVRRLIASEIGIEIDYVSVADDETLEELSGPITRPALVLVAVRVGPTRLIDNIELS